MEWKLLLFCGGQAFGTSLQAQTPAVPGHADIKHQQRPAACFSSRLLPTTGRMPRMLVAQRLGRISDTPCFVYEREYGGIVVPPVLLRGSRWRSSLTTCQQNREVDLYELFISEDVILLLNQKHREGGTAEDFVLRMDPRSAIVKVVIGLWGDPTSRVASP